MTVNQLQTRRTLPSAIRRFSNIQSRLFLCFALLFIATACATSASEPVDYLGKVKPILQQRCFACHGALKQEAGLRLDTAALAIQGGDAGAVIHPGDASGKGSLLERIAATDDQRMPPHAQGEALTAEQIVLLRNWIAAGALAPANEEPEPDPSEHWAFQPIVRPAIPEHSSPWIRNPIDAFLHEQHIQQELSPQPEASRPVLLRRLHLDLIGIPPSLAEIAACENDLSPNWYEETVKRLLDDPRHGERWARHWMDIWRYSDWWGLGQQLRNSQKHIWHWRDWIIESLNEDMPYDEMVRLMLAADELHPNDLSQLRATGFLARNFFLFNRPQWMEETVEHVSKAFLGLTMNCAKCHDHKFDPLAQEDFYRMRAFFEPYHVRMDVVPGEADLERDGIPRAFDGLLDQPTYLYIRGDENNPDKSTVIEPGVPEILAFAELDIEPVALPDEAWQPERRAWVIDANLAAMKSRVSTAETALKESQEKLMLAIQADEAKSDEHKEAEPKREQASVLPLVVEQFNELDTARWKLFGGDWVHQPGQLSQQMDGATTSALRFNGEVPQDFDATIRFTIQGGSRWRSVGLSFDVSQADATQPAIASDSGQTIYVSAYSGGSKVQVSLQQGSTSQYPTGGAVRAIPIQLNQSYTLQVQVRGSLINASLNGEPMIAWETPLARRTGAFQLFTFDALADFHEVTISALDPAIQLRKSTDAPVDNLAAAELELALAETDVDLARAELEFIKSSTAALQAKPNATEHERQALIAAAVRAERLVQLAKARHSLAVAEQGAQRAAADKKEASTKVLMSARDALDKAVEAANAEVLPSDSFSRLTGAKWAPTRFFDSGKDDPQVEFRSTSSGRRTALANWITDRRNPLAARVAVNHIWTRHFGQPLVPTVFDFGRNGTPPTQPELLDWLASELMDSGWSMKHLHSLIVSSSAYRMSSSLAGAELAETKDPENHYWWRRVPLRIESQVVRDALLSLAGTLDATMYGPTIPESAQATSTRRSIYFFHSNNERNLFLTTFDEALVKDCYRRDQSIVPQQALALSNSQLVLDAAEQIAKQLTVTSADDATFIRNAFRVTVGFEPSQAEVEATEMALQSWRALPAKEIDNPLAKLVWALINHNDFVTLR
jgi:mono/diheme cytochrome c family protein